MLLQIATAVAEGKELTAEDREAYLRHGSVRYRQGYTVPLLIREARFLQASVADCIQRNFNGIEMSYLVPDTIILWGRLMLCWKRRYAGSFSRPTRIRYPAAGGVTSKKRTWHNQTPKQADSPRSSLRCLLRLE